MVTHIIPCAGAGPGPRWDGPPRADAPDRRASAAAKRGQPAGLKGRHGPFRVALHAAPRRQGSGVDSSAVPRGAGARRLRGPLLLSNARSPGARRRRQRALDRDRNADRAFCALFGGARAICGGALRHERSSQHRRRGQGDPHRAAQVTCGDRGRGGVRRFRPQVSDLGARPLSCGTRGGHREGPRAQEAAWLPGGGGRSAWSTGMMAGSGSRSAVAGGLARHIPVLGRPAAAYLAVRDGGVYVDATFGAGGYARAILAAAKCRVIAIDRDQTAIARGTDLVEESGGRLVLVEERFSNLAVVARDFGHDEVDGVVFDLGVS